MLKYVIAVAAIGVTTPVLAQNMNGYGYAPQGQHSVQGYTSNQGGYVQPHMQTNPNNTTTDNWSTQGNVNPYTGQRGHRSPY